MERLELELTERVVQRWDAGPGQPSRQPRPLTGDAVPDFAELPEDMGPVSAERNAESTLPDLMAGPQELEAGLRVAECHERGRIVMQPESFGQRSSDRALGTVRRLERVGRGLADPTARGGEPGVVEDERALSAGTVRVGEDVFVHVAGAGDEVVQEEVVRLGEPRASVEQREDLAFVPLDKPRIGTFVEGRAAEFHAVLFPESLDLAVAEHRQARKGGQDGRDAEVLVALAELLQRGLLVRVAHEVDVALEDLRIEFDRLLDDLPIARSVLVAEHVHERAVIDAMHAERPDEIALEQPERLRQQERPGDLRRDPVDDLAPELDRHPRLERPLRDGVFRP